MQIGIHVYTEAHNPVVIKVVANFLSDVIRLFTSLGGGEGANGTALQIPTSISSCFSWFLFWSVSFLIILLLFWNSLPLILFGTGVALQKIHFIVNYFNVIL